MFVKAKYICIILLFIFIYTISFVQARTINGTGVTRIGAVDPVTSKPMDAVAFYPGVQDNRTTPVGPYDINATWDAKMIQGKYPLVVISHGGSGSLWGHHDLASAIAARGYIVITLTHPGDNYQDNSGSGAVSTVYGRPLQLSAIVTAALKNSSLAPYIDSDRIAFIGFSAGGQTGLLLAGAKPDFRRLETYCKSRLDESVCENKGKIREDRSDVSLKPDPRLRAFILIAPVSAGFSSDSLKNIRMPVMIYVGEKDRELSPDENAVALARNLPGTPVLKLISGAGHFTFLAPCTERLRQSVPDLCNDEPSVDRTAIHQKISAEITDFLKENLK